MQLWARVTIGLLAAFAAMAIVLAYQPWDDTQRLETPPEADLASVTFECGPLLGTSSVSSPREPLTHPTTREPCRDRDARRRLVAVDLTIVITAAAGVLLLSRRQRQGASEADVVHVADVR